MRVNPAQPTDLPRIHEMITALSAFHSDIATVTLPQLEQALFTSGLSTALLAYDADLVVGYAALNFTIALHTGAPRIDIHHLYVDKDHRTKGVGRALISAASAIAREKGAQGMTIGTDPKNRSAQAAYRAMGLHEITDAGPRFWIPVDQ